MLVLIVKVIHYCYLVPINTPFSFCFFYSLFDSWLLLPFFNLLEGLYDHLSFFSFFSFLLQVLNSNCQSIVNSGVHNPFVYTHCVLDRLFAFFFFLQCIVCTHSLALLRPFFFIFFFSSRSLGFGLSALVHLVDSGHYAWLHWLMWFFDALSPFLVLFFNCSFSFFLPFPFAVCTLNCGINCVPAHWMSCHRWTLENGSEECVQDSANFRREMRKREKTAMISEEEEEEEGAKRAKTSASEGSTHTYTV